MMQVYFSELMHFFLSRAADRTYADLVASGSAGDAASGGVPRVERPLFTPGAAPRHPLGTAGESFTAENHLCLSLASLVLFKWLCA